MRDINATVIRLPSCDTGRYESSEFLMSSGDATLTINVAEMRPIKINFFRVRWQQFTALYNCTAEQMGAPIFPSQRFPAQTHLRPSLRTTALSRRHMGNCITIESFWTKQDATNSMLSAAPLLS